MRKSTAHRQSATPPHNLPALPSSFIGRKREMAEVLQLLRTERLVTLTGAGGSGKTRLAFEVARGIVPEFEDGAWVVEFASLKDARLVPQAVASVLNIRERPGRPLTNTLVDALRLRQVLLLLDNCEHLLQACSELTEALLRACPAVTILATSREALNIAGETIRIVPPLPLPERSAGIKASRVMSKKIGESEAVQLFVARARAVVPGFELAAENAGAVAEICLRLDGIPLAIELAAARLRAITVQQVAALLVDRFRLLTGGGRTAPARQRTLEATLDWSYALLASEEQQVLQALSVFAGGCTLEAALAICVAEQARRAEVRDALGRLVGKSLVVAETGGEEVRYRLLETIREYALKRLTDSGDAAATRDRHLDYFVSWSERAETLLLGPEMPIGVRLFTDEHDNLRAALDWSLRSPGKAGAGLRLAAATGYYWRIVGYHTEGRTRLLAVLQQEDAQSPTLPRARAIVRAGLHAFYQSDYPSCRALAEEARRIAATHGASGRKDLADALELLAEVASETGDYAKAAILYEEALPIYEQVGDLIGQGDTRKMVGWLAMRAGDYERAKMHLEEGLAVCRQSGELRHIASALSGMGELAIRTGRYAEARKSLDESLSISRATGEKWNIAINLGSLGWTALLQRDFTEMGRFLGESLAIRMETGDRGGIAWCLEKLAEAHGLQLRPQKAVAIFGAASALRAPLGSAMDEVDKPKHERLLSELGTALGEERFAAAWAEGNQMELDQVLEYALAEFGQGEPKVKAKERWGGLTEREREVATLMAQGKSNREIAEAMTVGLKTVETYVTRMLDKLGLDSRLQIALWALENGLAKKEET